MDYNIVNNIQKTIEELAVETDKECSKYFKSNLFFMPELSFTFNCAKKFIENDEDIFGAKITKIKREESLGNNEINDLILELKNNKTYVFEFKLDCDSSKYVADIIKLHNMLLEKNFYKICVFIKSFSEKDNVEDWFNKNIINYLNNIDHFKPSNFKKIESETKKRNSKDKYYAVTVWWIDPLYK